MPESDQNACCSPTTTSLIAFAQTAIGCGLGLLLSGKLGRSAQRNTAITMLAVGAVATVPVIYDAIEHAVNRPTSSRGLRRRLRSIREDSGFSEPDVF